MSQATKATSLRVWLMLGAVLLLGAVLRFQAISNTIIDHPIRADARVYYLAALNLERWNIFSRAEPGPQAPAPDAFVQPGLPLAISPFIEFPPTERMLFRFNTLQVLLGVATIALTFALFRLFAGPSMALGAAALVALSPHLVVMTTYLLTETLFTFLLTAGTALLAFALRDARTAPALAAGLLLGASALTRATTEYLPLFLLVALYPFCDARRFRRTILPAAATALLAIIAWKLRNLATIGSLGDPTLMISTLHHGMYPGFMFNAMPESLGAPYRFDPFTQQIDGAGSVLAELSRRAGADPLLYLYWYLIGKPVSLLSWNMIDGIGDIFLYPVSASPYFDQPLFTFTRELIRWLHAPLSLAAIAGGLVALLRPGWLDLDVAERRTVLLLVALILYFFAIHAIGAPFPRYGIPLRPVIYGLGLFTFIRLGRCLLSSCQNRQTER